MDYTPIITPQEVVNDNKELLAELMELSFSDLKILNDVNNDKRDYIKEEINFKIFSDSLDGIDKIEIKKFRNRLSILATLVQVAIDKKFNNYLERVK